MGFRLALLASAICAAAIPSAANAGSQPPPEVEAAVRSLVGKAPVPTYRYAVVNLNDDERQDVLIILSGPQWCGSGGCTMAVFAGAQRGYQLISRSTIVNEPVHVLGSKQRAWHTLLVSAKQKGLVQMPYTGRRYPANPSLQPQASPSQVAEGPAIQFTTVSGAE